MEKKRSIAIVGGGIAGLALGVLLKRRGFDLTLYERSGRTGGVIRSVEEKGFLFELGPRSCRSKGNGLYTLKLIEEVGLTSEVVFSAKEAARRYLFSEGRLLLLPTTPLALLTSKLTRPLLLPLLKEPFIPPSKRGDETILSFAERRFGRYAAERFFDPMTSGIYAGEIAKLSIKSCFPTLYRWEKEQGSLLKGALKAPPPPPPLSPFVEACRREPLFSLRRGMQSLTDRLEEELKGSLRKNSEIEAIEAGENSASLIAGGRRETFEKIALAIPSHELQKMLPDIPTIKRASLATVCLGYRERLLRSQGFGHLIPSSEKEATLGIVWDSSAFPSQNLSGDETRLTVMIGGSRHPEIALLSESAIEKIALDAVKRQLAIEKRPSTLLINSWKEAIAQYEVGHDERVEALEKKLPKSLLLLGSSYRGVAVNDAIKEAYLAAEEIV